MARKSNSTLDATLEQLEAQARKNAAWGQFAAYTRAQGYEQQVAALDEQIRDAQTSGERKQVEQAKRDFVDRARRSTTLHVGGH